MTVKITKPALNLREELASLRNQGSAYEESKFYLDNLVTNGTFDSDTTGWTAGNNATISQQSNGNPDGNINVYSGAGSNGFASQTITTVVGETYTLSFDYYHVSGNNGGYVNIGTSFGGDQYAYLTLPTTSSWNTHSRTFQATTTTTFIGLYSRSSGNGNARYDNISVYETDGTDTIHSTPYGYEVKDVYIDGDLAREGEAYDYTVHDGYIKPTIEPTASTETCLIGVRK